MNKLTTFCGCSMSVCCACVHDYSPTAIITFYALRAACNNFSQNVEMCCFSCYLYWKSEWICMCLLSYVYWLQKYFQEVCKGLFTWMCPFCILFSIKSKQCLPPPPQTISWRLPCYLSYRWWKNLVESSHLEDWEEDARIALKWTLGKLATRLGSGKDWGLCLLAGVNISTVEASCSDRGFTYC